MVRTIERREFLKRTAAGCALCAGVPHMLAASAYSKMPTLVSPGCRGTKVRVGKVYMGKRNPHWPTPTMIT